MNDKPDRPTVTIVMTSRERFSLTAESLERVYETAGYPFDLVYVDAGSPPVVARRVTELAARRGFQVVRVQHIISPNHARNLGIQNASGTYIAFVDNDVDFRDGWLAALVACAEEEKAAVVGPLYLQGPLADSVVHMAGGDMTFEGTWGSRSFTQVQRHFLDKLANVPAAELTRQECDIIEFHCALVRREVLSRVGWMDEGLLTTREHLDFCLRVQALGGKIYFEPAATMTYLTPPPFTGTDLRYFLIRWSDLWTRQTLVHFAQKYGITPAYVDRVAKTRARRQHLVFQWLRPQLERRVGRSATDVLIKFLATVEPWYTQRLASAAYARLSSPDWREGVTSHPPLAAALPGDRP
jgi:GT2 family glycosyltransferase